MSNSGNLKDRNILPLDKQRQEDKSRCYYCNNKLT